MTEQNLCASYFGQERESWLSYYDNFPLEDGVRVFTLGPDDECGVILTLCHIADVRGEAYTIKVADFTVYSAKVRMQELTPNLCRLLLAFSVRERVRGIKKFRYSEDFPRLDNTGRGFDTNYACLRHFGLTHRTDILESPAPNKKAKTTWALTDKGRDFCRGIGSAASSVRVSGHKLVSVCEPEVFIGDILDENYLALPYHILEGKNQS